MSHFYGTLQGNRGSATRCGSKESGITTYTASWEGAVRTAAYYDEQTNTDMVIVELVPWHGAGTERRLYSGPISGKAKKK